MTPEQHLIIAEELAKVADKEGINAVTRDAAVKRAHLHAHIAMAWVAVHVNGRPVITLDTSNLL